MAFQTSNSVFENVFGPEPEQTPTEYFLQELGLYLRKRKSPLAQAMGQHIQNGGDMALFQCREDICPDMAEELYEREIPYTIIASPDGRYGFAVRAADNEIAMDARNSVLTRRSRTCITLSGQDMQKQAAASGGTDKSCLAIHGLSLGQAQIFKQKFAEYNDAAKIGIDRMTDGTYTLTLFGKDSVKKRAGDAPDVCKAYLDTVLLTGGANGVKNNALATLQAELQEKIANNFETPGVYLNKTPLWIVGSGQQYMRITANGFTYGRAVVEGNNVHLHQLVQADVIQPDYQPMLVSYTNRIPCPMLTYNQTEVMAHFQKEKIRVKIQAQREDEDEPFDILDVAPTAQNTAWARGEKKMAALLDTMIMRKIQNDQIMIMDGRYHEKFAHYTDELKKIMKDIYMGRLPSGYSPEETKRLRELMDKYKLEGEMYEQALQNMQNIDAVAITATIDRLADVAERIDQERAAQLQKLEEKRQERAAKTKGRASRSPSLAKE